MSEAEDFEFRLRMEKEAEASAPHPQMQPASMLDRYVGSSGGRFALGMASPAIAAAQLVGGEGVRSKLAELEASKQRGMRAAGTEGVDLAGMAGAMLPGMGIAGAVGRVLPTAASVLGRAGVGFAQGAAASAAQPSSGITAEEYFPQKAAQIGVGGVVQGALPLIGGALGWAGGKAKEAIAPFTEKGRADILRQTQLGYIPESARQKVFAALANAKQLVPGSRPTAGEVLSDIPEATGIAAHQKMVSTLPSVSPQFMARQAEQEGARSAALGAIAGTPQAMKQAIEARTLEASQKYPTAFRQSVQPDEALAKLLKRPSLTLAFSRAKDLAAEEEKIFTLTDVQGLHYMKRAMDDLTKNPDRFGLGADQARSIGKTKDAFIQWIDEKAPAYAEARAAYQAASQLPNRMEVGQVLQNAMTSPLGTSERSGVLAQAIRNAPQTLKKATGEPRYSDLAQVLNPQEVESVENVMQDLARKDAYTRLARGTKMSGGDAIPGKIGLEIPPLLYRPAMVAGFMLKHVAKNSESEIAKQAAAQYLDPALLLQGLQGPQASQRKAIVDAIMQHLSGVAGTATGRAF